MSVDTPSPTEPEVLVERLGPVLVITLNRPHRKNALTGSLSHLVAAAVDTLESDPQLAVGVLTGAGGDFSTGMDLGSFADGLRPDVPGRGLCGITRTPPAKPMIAAVEGWALAGGLEVMLACDLVIASRTARFGVPEVRRGLVAGAGAAYQLPRRLPPAIALELLLTGDPINADRAAAIGLVTRLVEAGQARADAIELARRIARNGPLAVRLTKEVARKAPDTTWSQYWEMQPAMMDRVMGSRDAAEGARAFLEKREPRWTGT